MYKNVVKYLEELKFFTSFIKIIGEYYTFLIFSLQTFLTT